MARKKRHFPARGILPPGHFPGDPIDLSARFCYFLDLNNWILPAQAHTSLLTTGGLGPHKQYLYDNAQQTLSESIRNQLNGDEGNTESLISNAIDFLKLVSENERRKEIAVINQYVKDLENKLPTVLKNNNQSDIHKLIERLNNFANNPESENMDTFYEELTICINTIRNTAQNISDRLKQLMSNNRKEFSDLTKDNTAFRFPSDVDGLIKNIIGLKASRKENSFADTIQRIVIDYIDKLIDKGVVNIDNFWPSVIGVLVDFERFLARQRKAQDLFKDFADISEKELKQLFNTFITIPTPFLHALQNETQQIKEIGEVLESNLGIRQLTDQKELEARANEITKRANTKAGLDANYGRNLLLNKHPQLYDAIKDINFIRWNAEGKDSVKQGRVGIEYEILNLIDKIGINVKGHPATDTVTLNLGRLTGDLNLDLTDLALKSLKPFVEEIENFAKKTRANSLSDLQNDFLQMNDNAANILKTLDSLIKMEDGKQLFIYHESLKMYTRIEEHKTNEFEGRELQLLYALDEIYSMNNFGGLVLPDRDLMYNLALNLSDFAVGGEMRKDVENYLSIFAGMLMFDDMANMAREFATQTEEALINYDNLKNIHMYLINDIYIPGSMVLSYIHKALSDGLTYLLSQRGRAAYARISVSQANKEIKDYVKLNNERWGSGEYSLSDWEDEREKINKGTKLKIIFLSSFFNLIENLQSHLS